MANHCQTAGLSGFKKLWDVMKRYRLPRESLLALNEQLTADEEETLPEGTCVIAYKR